MDYAWLTVVVRFNWCSRILAESKALISFLSSLFTSEASLGWVVDLEEERNIYKVLIGCKSLVLIHGDIPTRLTGSISIEEVLSLISKSHPPRVFYLFFNRHTVRARPIRATRAHPELVHPPSREYFFHLQLGNRTKNSIRVDRSHGLERTLEIR